MTKTILSPEDKGSIMIVAATLAGIGCAIKDRSVSDLINCCAEELSSFLERNWTAEPNKPETQEKKADDAGVKSCKKSNSATRRVEICKKAAKKDSSGNIFGSFTDPRDEQTYRTVYLPELKQTWMLENLKYNPKKKGHWTNQGQHYYNFDLAQKVAPKGWRVPSKDDFIKLTESLSREKPNKLWGKYEGHLQGWIGSEFKLYGKGSYGNWWSSTVSGSADACFLAVNEAVYCPQAVHARWNGHSVRCVQDLEK